MSAFGLVAFFLIVTLPLLVAAVVPARSRLVVWTVVVVAAVVPWIGWTDHAHWDRIQWVPFSGVYRLRDVVLNVLFYVPIGVFYVQRRPGRARAVAEATLYGLALSALTEFSQVFSHGRFPSVTDLVTNVAGAWLGAWTSVTVRRRVRRT